MKSEMSLGFKQTSNSYDTNKRKLEKLVVLSTFLNIVLVFEHSTCS